MALVEVNDPNRPARIALEMKGPALDQGIPLHVLLAGFCEVQEILDKSYLALLNRQRMTHNEREKFFLRANTITQGSIHADIDLVVACGQATFALANTLGPTTIWEYTKQAYDLLKVVFAAIKADRQPQYSFVGRDKSVLHVNTGTQSFTYNGPVFMIAQTALPHYQAIDELLNESGVHALSFGNPRHPEITRTVQAKGSLELPTVIEERPVELECEILSFNKLSNTGKLNVFEGQIVEARHYKFDLSANQDIGRYISAMLRKHARATCLRMTTHNPLNNKRVIALRIIQIS